MKKVLFICTGNSCRSQMAEGFLKAKVNDKVEVYSAGLKADGLNPRTVKVMKEAGVDISSHISETIDKYIHTGFDYVITVCDHANEYCPVFTGKVKNRIHYGFSDPANAMGNEDEILGEYRRVRDEISAFCNAFFEDNLQ